MQDKLEFIIVDFVERNELPNGFSFDEYETKEKNELPNGYDSSEYESKGFFEMVIV